jgi:Ni2+-binding GTPase involved in maturation of urease and hydrogenase
LLVESVGNMLNDYKFQWKRMSKKENYNKKKALLLVESVGNMLNDYKFQWKQMTKKENYNKKAEHSM